MSGDPLLRFMGNGEEGLEVIQTERGAVAPGARLILEWAGEGRCEERSLLAVILPDGGLDVPAPDRAEKGISC